MLASFIKSLLYLFSLLSLPNAHRLGSWIGWWLAVTPNQARRISKINIGLCFPNLSATDQQQLLEHSLIESAKAVTETGALWRWDAGRVLALVRRVSGEAYYREANAHGKGVIIIAPHLGAWEMVGLYCAAQYPMVSLYRPPRLKALETMICHARQRSGAKLVPTNAYGVKTLFRTLAAGKQVGILPDQDAREDGGIFAPFFGVPASTMVLLSRLAAKTGATLLFCYAERLPNGEGYYMHFVPAPAGIDDSNLEHATTQLNLGVEQCVRQHPEQYQWSYKRFRSRPPGETRLYGRS
ncbi:MAG: lysophospholipid acyltransferase family protein [Gammaproteobacteria bacterium]|nr:lysophospholipid acyltransferase family protein [Gammaproteobacteria bacterium]